MMDPSHNFKKIRNCVEKSSPCDKTARHLVKDGKDIVWDHWKQAYAFSISNHFRTNCRLTSDHFTLSPTLRMRNHLADDVLSTGMINVFEYYKASLIQKVKDGSMLDQTIEFTRQCSILIKNFKSKLPYSQPDDSRFDENLAVLEWFLDWEKKLKMSTQLYSYVVRLQFTRATANRNKSYKNENSWIRLLYYCRYVPIIAITLAHSTENLNLR
eukprot:Seg1267.3 transcript_id=Seg1267.3/GoldUCD/mRNA.D3Y31 product="hypothetical protein" protein_id=Seg1267.3/GoldUCD/D3Y31